MRGAAAALWRRACTISWQPLLVAGAFLGGALFHLQSTDAGFRAAFQDNAVLAVAQGLLRIPFVYARVLVRTPEAIPIVIGASALLAIAWWSSVGERRQRLEPIIEIAGVALMILTVAWFLRFGAVDWASTQDYQKDWRYYTTLQQAVQTGRLPLYSRINVDGRTPNQRTERYFANAETPVGPDGVLLAVMNIRTFYLFHTLLTATAGGIGLVLIRRELQMAPFGWALLVIAFALNGHITAHLSAGHTPWVNMWLLPWVFWCSIRLRQGDESPRLSAVLALCLAAMILSGGWHIFMWSAMFVAFASLGRRVPVAFLARLLAIVIALAAFRLVPAFLTVGGGAADASIGGFSGLGDVLRALLTEGHRPERDFFLGWFGAGLLLVGLIPSPARRTPVEALRLPAVGLCVLSLGSLYQSTLFHLPVFVSQRVPMRFAATAALALLVIGCRSIQEWPVWRRATATAWLSLAGSISLVMQLTLLAAATRPPLSALPPAITDNLKIELFEAPYVWSVRIGIVIALVALAYVVQQLRPPIAAVRPSAITL